MQGASTGTDGTLRDVCAGGPAVAGSLARLLADDVSSAQWARLMDARVRRLTKEEQIRLSKRGELADLAALVLADLPRDGRSAIAAYLACEKLRHTVRQGAAFDIGLSLGRATVPADKGSR